MIKSLKKIVSTLVFFILLCVSVVAKDADITTVENGIRFAFETVKNVDVEKANEYITDESYKKYLENVQYFFDEYPESEEKVKKMFAEIDYKIVESIKSGDSITSKVHFTMPNYKEIIKKAMPKIITRNFLSLFTKKLSNKIYKDVIDIIYDELKREMDKTEYNYIDFDYNFRFEKKNNLWSFANFDDLAKNISGLFKVR